LIAALKRIGVPMTTDGDSRYLAVVENYETFVRAMGEALQATNERIDRMERRFEARFDALDAQLIRMHADVAELKTDVAVLKADVAELKTNVATLTTRVDGLEVFARDAQERLKRIETHLQLGSPRRSTLQRKAARTSLRKRPRNA
jgi:chromosome segregation ATPase